MIKIRLEFSLKSKSQPGAQLQEHTGTLELVDLPVDLKNPHPHLSDLPSATTFIRFIQHKSTLRNLICTFIRFIHSFLGSKKSWWEWKCINLISEITGFLSAHLHLIFFNNLNLIELLALIFLLHKQMLYTFKTYLLISMINSSI